MKYIKMLGLLAVAAAALMAFAGVASATTVTSGGATYDGEIKASAGPTNLTGSFVKVECSSSIVEGDVEKHGEKSGETTLPASGNISHLTFSGCNFEVTVLKAGSLSIVGSGGGNGTLTSSNAEISIHTSVGTCVFTTNKTHVGTLTAGEHAKIDIASAKIPRTGGNFLCGSSGTWNAPGGYTVSSPTNLSID